MTRNKAALAQWRFAASIQISRFTRFATEQASDVSDFSWLATHDHVSRYLWGESLLTPFLCGTAKLFPFTKRLNSNTAPILPPGQRPLSPALQRQSRLCARTIAPFCKHSELHHQA